MHDLHHSYSYHTELLWVRRPTRSSYISGCLTCWKHFQNKVFEDIPLKLEVLLSLLAHKTFGVRLKSVVKYEKHQSARALNCACLKPGRVCGQVHPLISFFFPLKCKTDVWPPAISERFLRVCCHPPKRLIESDRVFRALVLAICYDSRERTTL